MDEFSSISSSGFPTDGILSNCSIFSHCSSDELSYTSISCSFVWEVAPPVQKYAPYVATVEAIFFVVSFCSNLMIIANFIKRRSILKDAAGIYLLNVAIVNFMFSIFIVFQCFLTESAKTFFVGNTDIIRCKICEFLGFMGMFLLTNTLHTLAALSFDRFFLFVKPLKYSKYFTWKIATTVVSIIWIVCTVLALPPLLGLGEYDFSTVIANCHPMWTGRSKAGIRNINYIIFIAFESLIPIILLIITNICMIWIALKSIKKRRHRWVANECPLQKDFPEINSRIKNKISKKQRQVAKVFGAFFVAHICCWMPVLTVLIIAAILEPQAIPMEVYVVSWVLFLTYPVVHPIIETYFVKDLRVSIIAVKKQFHRSISKRASAKSLLLVQNSKRNVTTGTKPQNVIECLETKRQINSFSTYRTSNNTSSSTQSNPTNRNIVQESQLVVPAESKELVSANSYEVSVTIKLPCSSVYHKNSSDYDSNDCSRNGIC